MMRSVMLTALCLIAFSVTAQTQVSQWVEQRITYLKQYYADQPLAALDAMQRLENSRAMSEADRGYVAREQATLLIEAERYDEAKRLLTEALEGKADDYVPPLRLALAQLLLLEGDSQQALPLLEAWFQYEQEPQISGMSLLAYTYMRLEHYEQAVVVFERLIETSADINLQWYELLAYAYTQSGRTEEAIVLLDTAIEQKAGDARWWRQLSSIFLLQENIFSGAASLAIANVVEDLSFADARRLAGLFNVLGMPSESARVIKVAMTRYPQEAGYEDHMLLGELYVLARETGTAISEFQQAAELSNSGEPALNIAQLHLQWERFAEAREALQLAIDRYGEAVPEQIWYLLAIVELNLDNLQAANEAIHRIDSQGSYGDRAARLDTFLRNQMQATAQE